MVMTLGSAKPQDMSLVGSFKETQFGRTKQQHLKEFFKGSERPPNDLGHNYQILYIRKLASNIICSEICDKPLGDGVGQ